MSFELCFRVNAADVQARQEVCHHLFVSYSGKVPCTGPLVCENCGKTFISVEELHEEQNKTKILTSALNLLSEDKIEKVMEVLRS
jgi:hypothetical protein